MKKINHSDQANDNTHLQIELPLNISDPGQVYTPHHIWDSLENTDPYWDELEQEELESKKLLLVAALEPPFVQEQFFLDNEVGNFTSIADQHLHTVGEQVSLVTECHHGESSVGEQVKYGTQKFAHQHEEPTHWIEKYWVERGHNKYWYFRYTWMAGRKLNRVYIGSVQSQRVKQKVEWVREAIAAGLSTLEIQKMIRGGENAAKSTAV